MKAASVSTPDRTRNVPSKLSENALMASTMVQWRNNPFFPSRPASGSVPHPPTKAGRTHFQQGPRTTTHPSPARSKPTTSPVQSPMSGTPRLPWPKGETSGPMPHPADPAAGLRWQRQGHRHAHVAHVQHGRVKYQARVLQQRVEIAPVGRDITQPQKGLDVTSMNSKNPATSTPTRPTRVPPSHLATDARKRSRPTSTMSA